jgi:hypothetical protein
MDRFDQIVLALAVMALAIALLHTMKKVDLLEVKINQITIQQK